MLDFIQLCNDHHVDYSLRDAKVTQGWVGVQCPFCGGDKYFLGYNLHGGFFNCWRCGGHPVPETIRKIFKIEWHEVFKLVKQYDTIPNRIQKKNNNRVSYIQLPSAELTYAEKQYIEGRNYSVPTLQKLYDIRSGGLTGEFQYRVVFPIMDQRGRVVSLVGRSIHKNFTPSYYGLTPEKSIIPWKQTLFGIHLLPLDAKKVIVVEGLFDQVRYGAGFLSTFGAEPSAYQIAQLTEFHTIYILYDGDETGKRKSEKLGNTLSVLGVPEVHKLSLDAKDPDSADEEEQAQIKEIQETLWM